MLELPCLGLTAWPSQQPACFASSFALSTVPYTKGTCTNLAHFLGLNMAFVVVPAAAHRFDNWKSPDSRPWHSGGILSLPIASVAACSLGGVRGRPSTAELPCVETRNQAEGDQATQGKAVEVEKHVVVEPRRGQLLKNAEASKCKIRKHDVSTHNTAVPMYLLTCLRTHYDHSYEELYDRVVCLARCLALNRHPGYCTLLPSVFYLFYFHAPLNCRYELCVSLSSYDWKLQLGRVPSIPW